MTTPIRDIKLATRLRLFWERPILTSLCAYMLLFPFFFMGISYTIVNRHKDKSIPDVDYEEVSKAGTLTMGTILNIESANESINNEHPAVITYRYKDDGKVVDSKFQTLSLDKVENMSIGDTIEIKYFKGESIPNGLVPGNFPWDIFFYAPLPALFIGVLLSIFLINSINKKVKLYRYGIVTEAVLLSFLPRPGLPLPGIGGGISVHYRYNTSGGHKMNGESVVKDNLIMIEKKPGDTIKIFVLPDDESKTCLIPQKEVITNNWKID